MKHFILILLLFTFCISSKAQTFTDHLRTNKGSKGSLLVIQDSEMEEIVNNSDKGKEILDAWKDKAKQNKLSSSQKRKAHGFRVQVYTGGNSRQDRIEASRIENKCKNAFPEVSVYRQFVSPRWICRVGDFKTYEEAAEYLNKIKELHISKEVRIVKCVVYL